MIFSDSLEIDGETKLRPRGSLSISGPRDLLAKSRVAGAFNPDFTVARDTLLWPNRLPDLVPDRLPSEPVVDVCDEEVVWGGCVQPHYGHFLTESVSRLWPLLPGGALEGLPVVCVRPPNLPYEQQWSAAFGARAVETPESGVVRFTRMFVPEPAWMLRSWVAPEVRDIHLHARRSLDVPSLPPQGILWLSRSGLEWERRAYDEALLEWILEEHVTLIHPEEKTLSEQIAAIEAGDGVAGLVGSAFHTLLAAREPPDCLFLCPGRVSTNYVTQDRLLGTNGAFVRGLAPAGKRRERRLKPWRGHRVLVPEALRALSETLLPGLREDSRIAAFAEPRPPVAAGGGVDDLDAAVAAVLLDPDSAAARTRLAKMFEERHLDRCAREQLLTAAELSVERPALDA